MSASKTGRPPVGPNINVRLPQELVDWIDEQAGGAGRRRARWIRERLEELRHDARSDEQLKTAWLDGWRKTLEEPEPVQPEDLTRADNRDRRWRYEEAVARRVVATWGVRHGADEPTGLGAATDYVDGVYRFRVGINNHLRMVHEIKYDTATKKRLRQQVDTILRERGELS